MINFLKSTFRSYAGCAAVVILGSSVLTGCSRQAPPPPPPPVQQRVETPDMDKDRTESRDLRIKSIAQEKFGLYGRKIRVADFPRAEAALRELRSVFDLEGEYKSFWDEALPASKRSILTLMNFCDNCRDGKCPSCGGKSVCEVCSGTGECQNCDKAPVRKQECRACICRTCTGTGRCSECGGFRNRKCRDCSGYGTVGTNTSAQCRRCGGSGTISGLKGASGTPTSLRCIACRGTGSVSRRVLAECKTCSGKGRVACHICSGDGRCRTCKGSGRSDSCSICNGTRFTLHNCPQCDGTGKCIKCEGDGKCTVCHGEGKCFECTGGLIRLYDFDVNSDWFKLAEGYVLYDVKKGRIVSESRKSGLYEVEHEHRNLTVSVQSGQIIFIATQPVFDSVISIVRNSDD